MTTHPKPARVDLGDGDSLILFRTDDWHTTVRFHSANPNTSLAGAVMATDALRDALDKIAPTDDTDYAALWKETARYQLMKIADRDDAHATCEWDRLELVRRAEKAEQERDEAIEQLSQQEPSVIVEHHPLTAREHLDAAWDAAHVPADEIIPKGAEYVERYGDGSFYGPLTSGGGLRADQGVLERRLLDPPAPSRPEGAEEIERLIRHAEGGGWLDDPKLLADYIASSGVRVTGGES